MMNEITDDLARPEAAPTPPDPSFDVAERAESWTYPPEVIANPSSMESEAIRGLRTRIMAQHVREGRRALAICTPSEGSGCTFVAVNLAASIAQVGVKVALVDADLRRPAIADALGIRRNPGIAEYLQDDVEDLDDVIRSDVAPGLSIITAGSTPNNPQELLSGDRFRAFVSQLMREFDLTIFDTTPANRCTDAQRVATVAGYNLIVARKHKSFIADVSTLAKMLRADRSVVVGSVLNAI
jgi:protein-tyrosine kinase